VCVCGCLQSPHQSVLQAGCPSWRQANKSSCVGWFWQCWLDARKSIQCIDKLPSANLATSGNRTFKLVTHTCVCVCVDAFSYTCVCVCVCVWMPSVTSSVNVYRPDAIPAAQPTVSKHWRQSIVAVVVVYKCEFVAVSQVRHSSPAV